MTPPIKLLILKPEYKLGNGLKAIREKSSEFIDITDYETALSDATSSTNPSYVIKENKVYRIIKTYIDLDNNVRIVLAKPDHERYDDIWLNKT